MSETSGAIELIEAVRCYLPNNRWVLRLHSPATRETLRGIAVHEVLSKYYELGEESRTIECLHEIFRGVMRDLIAEEKKVSSSSLGLRST